jgi:hypothetical protein
MAVSAFENVNITEGMRKKGRKEREKKFNALNFPSDFSGTPLDLRF